MSAYPLYEEEEEPFTLPHVRNLSIGGRGADEETIEAVVDLCPALLSVDLSTSFNNDTVSYREALTVLPPTLHSIKLRADRGTLEPADLQLRRFTQLQSLDLDRRCYFKKIGRILIQLPLLVEVRLGGGFVSTRQLINLVSGPRRLPHLKHLTLDFLTGKRGRRIIYDTRSTFTREIEMEGWSLSEDLRTGELRSQGYVYGIIDLILRAEANGIKVGGTIHEALTIFQDYYIEAYNRAILDAGSGRDLETVARILSARAKCFQAAVPLPSLDSDSLGYIFELFEN